MSILGQFQENHKIQFHNTLSSYIQVCVQSHNFSIQVKLYSSSFKTVTRIQNFQRTNLNKKWPNYFWSGINKNTLNVQTRIKQLRAIFLVLMKEILNVNTIFFTRNRKLIFETKALKLIFVMLSWYVGIIQLHIWILHAQTLFHQIFHKIVGNAQLPKQEYKYTICTCIIPVYLYKSN